MDFDLSNKGFSLKALVDLSLPLENITITTEHSVCYRAVVSYSGSVGSLNPELFRNGFLNPQNYLLLCLVIAFV